MDRIEVNVKTGEQTTVPLTVAEIDDAAIRTTADLKVTKRQRFIAEGVTRIAAEVSDWDSLEAIKTAAGMWPAIGAGATPAMILAKDIYLYVRDTVPGKLAALSSQAELAAVDPTAADPFGDGTPWPT